MGATQLVARSQEAGIESIWAPITDKWLPESMAFLTSLVQLLLERFQEDKVVVVVCPICRCLPSWLTVNCVRIGQHVA